MKLTKFGHCCFLIEDQGVRILTDPGRYSTVQDVQKNIDLVVLSHEHGDHVRIESLEKVMQNNPQAEIITNTAVANLLQDKGYKIHIVEEGANYQFNGMLIEAFGDKHAVIYPGFTIFQCTGYFFNNKFFLPGDNFNNPGKQVEILGMPVAGPWLKISEAIDYALAIKPRIAIPVHDGHIKVTTSEHAVPPKFLGPAGIEFKVLELNQEYEF